MDHLRAGAQNKNSVQFSFASPRGPAGSPPPSYGGRPQGVFLSKIASYACLTQKQPCNPPLWWASVAQMSEKEGAPVADADFCFVCLCFFLCFLMLLFLFFLCLCFPFLLFSYFYSYKPCWGGGYPNRLFALQPAPLSNMASLC